MKRLALTDYRKCYADMGLLLLALTLGNVAGAQSVPLPEYYGIYAIDKGKLVNLFGGRSSQQPTTRTIELFSFKSGSSEGRPAMELSPDVRFLVFDQSPVEASQGLYIYRSPYARNLRMRNPDPAIMGGGRDQVLAINKRLAARVEAFRVGLAAKPVPGQPQMVEVVPEYELPSGTYLIYGERERKYEYHWFVVGSPEPGEASDCIDLDFEFGGFGGRIVKATYYDLHGPVEFLEITKGHYVPCGSSVGVQPSGRSGVGSIHVSCDDYTSCLNGGVTAFNAHRWDESLAYFEEAARIEPGRGDAWVGVGGVYLEMGRYSEAWSVTDKGLQLGATVGAHVCRERTLRPCQKGTFLLSRKQVTFIDSKGQKVFSAPLSEVTSQEALRLSFIDAAYSRLKISGKNYSLYLIPEAVRCKVNSVVECPEPGFTQQKVFANYVHHVTQELASGSLANTEPKPADSGSTGPQPPVTGFLPPAATLDTGGYLGWLGYNEDFEPTPLHLGVDFGRSYGDPVFAIADGEIVEQRTDVGSYGGVGVPGGAMIIRHKTDNGRMFYALYGHLENMKSDRRVKRGEQIATIGHYYQEDKRDTPHLHFGVFFGNELPQGNNWPWRQYIGDLSTNPGWQDPIFVLKNLRPGDF